MQTNPELPIDVTESLRVIIPVTEEFNTPIFSSLEHLKKQNGYQNTTSSFCNLQELVADSISLINKMR